MEKIHCLGIRAYTNLELDTIQKPRVCSNIELCALIDIVRSSRSLNSRNLSLLTACVGLVAEGIEPFSSELPARAVLDSSTPGGIDGEI
jgi:hypothetical protein